MSEREDVAFASGTDTCAAWLYRPEGVSGPAPCVVMAHGFSTTRADTLPAYAERFAAAGMAVLLFDYRHFGDSTGEPRQLLDIGRQQDDYRAAIAFARTLGGIDAQRIALFGTSFSGGHVVAVAAKDPSLRAVVAQAPFADGLATVATVPPRNALRGTLLGLADQVAALAGRRPRMMPAVGPAGTFAVMTAPDAKAGFDAIVPPDSPPGPAVKMAERAPRGEVARFPIGHFEIYVGEHFERAVAVQTEFLRRHLARVGPAAAVA
jgi:uncharacterized protein